MTTSTDTIVDKAESGVQELADSDADSTNSNIRYMAYGSRLRTALVASTRYVAYVSWRAVIV
jgi:fission process protein 1